MAGEIAELEAPYVPHRVTAHRDREASDRKASCRPARIDPAVTARLCRGGAIGPAVLPGVPMPRPLPLVLALLVAACAAQPAVQAPRSGYQPQTAVHLTGGVAVNALDYRPRGGIAPQGSVRDVPGYVTGALKAELRRAGARLDSQRCVLDGTIRDFKVDRQGAEEHYGVDIRYVLTVGTGVQFDQAFGTTFTVARGQSIDRAVDSAIAKNINFLLKDDWFQTLLVRECSGRT
jgi:hypothetical protein